MFSKKGWLLLFSITFLLGLDYWAWDEVVSLSAGGFPNWIYYFVFIQLLLVLSISLFSKYYWGKNKDK